MITAFFAFVCIGFVFGAAWAIIRYISRGGK